MKILYINIILIGALFLTACTDELDLKPPQDIDTGVALSTDANVKTVLVGAYDGLSFGSLFGGNTLRNSELLGADGEIQFSGTFGDPADIWRKQINNLNSDVANVWLNSYYTINICNNVISALEVVNEEDQALVEAEARFLRGLMYFELIKFFAVPYSAGGASTNLGVPVPTEPNSVEEIARETVEFVYQYVIDDLTFAEENLPTDNDVYANRVAAAGILSRVYLQQEDFAAARDAANRGIGYADGVFETVNVLEDAFNNPTNSTEDVFAIQVTTQDGSNNMQLFFASPTLGGRGDIEIQPSHFDTYEVGDLRADLFYVDEASGDTRSGKWTNQFANVNLLRLSELYLTRAEANLREGTVIGDTPANDINVTRSRAGLTDNLNPNLQDVLNERKAELALEGHRIHDIKRLRLETDGFQFDAQELIFPIPLREEGVNTNL
jgi:hypothetical protein